MKKNRDPRWEEEFHFTLDEPPTNEKMHIEVLSASSRIGLLHPKVYIDYKHLPRHFILWSNHDIKFLSLALVLIVFEGYLKLGLQSPEYWQ